MKHKNDERIQQFTCPGCNHHLPQHGGLNQAQTHLDKDQAHSLNGYHPEAVLELVHNSFAFWCSQQRASADFYRYQAKQFQKRNEEMKEQYRATHAEMQQEVAQLRQALEASEARCQEVKHEQQLVMDKYNDEVHKVCDRAVAHPRVRAEPPRPFCLVCLTSGACARIALRRCASFRSV